LVAAANFLVAATKILSVVPNFVAVAKPFFFRVHGIKGFVIPTKSFVKIGIKTIFCYNNKMLSSTNKTFGCCSQIFGCSKKKLLALILLP